QTNSGFMFVALKPLAERDASVSQVIGRLRPKLGQVAGARLFLQPVQDIRVGGRQSNALYQYTLQSDDLNELYNWSPKVTDALDRIFISTAGGTVKGTQATNALPGTVSSNNRPATNGTAANSASTAAAQLNAQAVRNQATNAIANSGRSATSTGAAVSTAHETMVPLSAVAHYETGNTPLAVNHQGLFVARTIAFNPT